MEIHLAALNEESPLVVVVHLDLLLPPTWQLVSLGWSVEEGRAGEHLPDSDEVDRLAAGVSPGDPARSRAADTPGPLDVLGRSQARAA